MTAPGAPRETTVSPSLALRRLVDGFQVSQALYVAATLHVADYLSAQPRPVTDIAEDVGVHAPSLYRMLRALASVDVFCESPPRCFALTAIGECLRSDAAEPIGGWAAFVGRPYHWAAWSALLHSIQTGANAFQHVHGQRGWDYRAQQPRETEIFDQAMTDLSRRASRSILDAFDFEPFTTIVDVGGGKGGLLAAILRTHPRLHGILVDLPYVVGDAESVLRTAGVMERCRVVACSFFKTLPGDGDAYLLKSVLHDWADEEAIMILQTCRRAMHINAKLLIVERMLEPAGATTRDVAFSDLEMLVGNGGLERTIDDYRALISRAGLRLGRLTRTASDMSVLEAVQA